MEFNQHNQMIQKPSSDYVPVFDSCATPKTDLKLSETTQQPFHQRPMFESQEIVHTRTSFNKPNYVEEHREKMTGSDGETKTARQ
jgi:hypothetical protein